MGHLSRLGCLVWAGCAVVWAADSGKTVMARLPLRFEENRGQFASPVRYTAQAGAYHLQLTDAGPAFRVGEQRVEIRMPHANPAPAIEALDRLGVDTNYMVGGRKQWHTAPNYARLRYHAVYPGVDIVYYGNQGQLEYDFMLEPGANPDAIRLEFAGADSLSITADGDLAIDAGGSQVVQKKPVIYQDGRRIAGRYTLAARNQAGLLLEKYDPARPLVIDPILLYCTYIGTSGQDQITAMKMGPKGRLYITGSTNTGGLQTIDGAYSDHPLGLVDIFLAIVDTTPNGNNALVYLSYLGGSNNDVPMGLDVDSNGLAYMTGYTTSTNFPMAGNSVQSTGAASTQDAFVAVIDPSQYGGVSLVYSTFLGGATGLDVGNGIAVDKKGLMYVVGTTRSTDFPVTTSGYAGVLYGPQDAFITVIDPTSTSLRYSTYMGGEASDDGRAIAVGSNGLVYFAANTYSTQFPMEGPFYRNQLQGAIDVVVGVIDINKFGNGSDGTPPSMIYSSYLGGSDLDEVRGMALDSNNRMILTGYTFSGDFPVTPDAAQSTQGGNGDAFVTIVNPNDPPHFLAYSTYFGGSQGEVAYGVNADTAGNIYLTGYTLSSDLFTVGAPQPGYSNGIDTFIAKIKPGVAGKAGIVFSTYLGAAGTYVGNAITAGADGSIYAAGYGQVGLPSSSNGNGYSGGVSDGFLTVMK